MDQFEPCEFFATCLPGAETLLARELEALGVRKVRPLAGGVTFYAKPAGVLRVCLWSRLAGRVNCTVGRASARDAEALYADVRQMAWEDEVGEGATIAVKVSGTNAALRNTQFTALKVKDAVCDRLAEVRGARPDVNPHEPDCLIEVRLRDERATVSVDLSGAALTHRSYLLPEDGDDAPLAVAQAAALLASLRAGEALAAGWGLFDAACDDGLLVCEAASAAADQAPGLLRERWGFTGWGRFDEATWDDLLAEADDRLEAGIAALLGSRLPPRLSERRPTRSACASWACRPRRRPWPGPGRICVGRACAPWPAWRRPATAMPPRWRRGWPRWWPAERTRMPKPRP